MIEIIPNWHPIFVHFTVALLSLSVLLFVLTRFVGGDLKEQWTLVARWCLWFGVGFTVFTGASGIYAYNTVDHDTASHLAMTEHRNWALVTIVAFFLLAGWSAIIVKNRKTFGTAFVALSIVAGLLLSSTAWHGGEVVYRYGLGVMSLPKVSGDGHAHDHGGGHDHGGAIVSGVENSHDSMMGDMDFSGMDMDDAQGGTSVAGDKMTGATEDASKDAHTHSDGHAHDH